MKINLILIKLIMSFRRIYGINFLNYLQVDLKAFRNLEKLIIEFAIVLLLTTKIFLIYKFYLTN